MPSLDLKLEDHAISRTPTKSSYDLAERERTRLTDANGLHSPLRRHTFFDGVDSEDGDDRDREEYMKRRTVVEGPRTPRTPSTAVPPMPTTNTADALKNAEQENERLKRELELIQRNRYSNAQQLERSTSSRSSTPSRGLERSHSERSSRAGTPSRGLDRERDSERTHQHRDSSVASDRHSRPSTPSRALDGLEKERERLNSIPDRHSHPSTPSSLAMQVEPLEIPALRIKKDSDVHRTASAMALERGSSRPSTPSRGLERSESKRRAGDGSPNVQVLIVTPSSGPDESFDRETYRPITVLESGERERAGLKREIDALKRENFATQQALNAAQEEDGKLMKELEALRKEAEKLKKENEKYAREIERRDRRMSMEGRTADALAISEHENDQLRDELEALKVTRTRMELELEETVLVAQRAQQELDSIPKAPTFVNPDMIMTAGLHQVKALNEGIRRLSHNIAAGLEWDRDAYAGFNARGNYNWRDKALAELTPFLGEGSIRYIKSSMGVALPLAAMQSFVQVLLVTFCDWKISTWLSSDATLADLFSQHKQGSGNRSVEPNDVPVYNALRWRAYLHEQFGNLLAEDTATTGHQVHRRQEFDGILNRLRTTGPWRFKVDRTIISSLFAGLLQNLDDLRQTLEAGTASLASYSNTYGIPSNETQDVYRQLVLWLVIPGTLVRENLVDVVGNVNANYDEVILGNAGFGFGSLSITSPDKRASMQSVNSNNSKMVKKCRLEFMHNYNCLPPVVVERSLPFLGAGAE